MPIKRKTAWLLFSISGLSLVGFGLSLAIDAGVNKFNNKPWLLEGTVALVIFNTGLSLFGRAVAEYVWLQKK